MSLFGQYDDFFTDSFNKHSPPLSDAYAQRVATGFRPSKPEKMDPELYDLIEWCWKQDPNERPQMKDVMECLIAIKANMEEAEEARRIRQGGGGCGCVIS